MLASKSFKSFNPTTNQKMTDYEYILKRKASLNEGVVSAQLKITKDKFDPKVVTQLVGVQIVFKHLRPTQTDLYQHLGIYRIFLSEFSQKIVQLLREQGFGIHVPLNFESTLVSEGSTILEEILTADPKYADYLWAVDTPTPNVRSFIGFQVLVFAHPRSERGMPRLEWAVITDPWVAAPEETVAKSLEVIDIVDYGSLVAGD